MIRSLVCAVVLVLCALPVAAQIHLTVDDQITISGQTLDSSGFYISPDSVDIIVYRHGTEQYNQWFNSTDPECTSSNGQLVFSDLLGDLDNDAGNGLYEIRAGFYRDAGDLYLWKTLWVYAGIDLAELAAVHDSLKSHDDWVLRATVPGRTLDIAASGHVGLDLSNTVGFYGATAFNAGTFVPGTFHETFWSNLRDTSYSATAQVLTDSTAAYQGPAAGLSQAGVYDTIATLLADSVATIEEFWAADSLAVDTSEIGAWLSVNAGGSDSVTVYEAVAAVLNDSTAKYQGSAASLSKGDVADTILRLLSGETYPGGLWDSLLSATDPALFASLNDTFQTNLIAISGDGPAADALESHLDGTGVDLALMPEGWSADDSSAFQGGAAGFDSSDIAGWVWNTPAANHAEPETFGGFLDAEISGLGEGSGAYTVTVLAYDSTADQVVPDVSVAVRNLAQTALLATGRTNINGSIAFNLDAGSYLLLAKAPGYAFATSDTITVTAALVDTVSAERFFAGTPVETELCRLYGHLSGIDGRPLAGASVVAALSQGVVRAGGRIVSPTAVTTETDSTGYFYLDLIPSDSLVPSGTTYQITISRPGGAILRQDVLVPAASSWRLDWQ